MSNPVTFDTVLTVQSSYEISAWINLTAVIFGFPLNTLIIFIGLKNKWAKKGYQFTVLCMHISQLYAVILETLLYVLYLLALYFKWEMTLLQCSVVRRVLQVSTIPSSFAPLVLSIDRYIYLVFGHKLQNRTIVIMFGIVFFYAYFVHVPFLLLPGTIGVSDVCGPALVMPKRAAYFIQPIEPIVICLAFVINLRLIYFVMCQSNRKTLESRGIRRRDFSSLRMAVFGLLIQVLVPFVFNIPQSINLALYNLDQSTRFSDLFWKIINFFVYFELFLNSLVTLIFVKQFRSAFLMLVRGVPSSNLTIQSSSRNDKLTPQFSNRPFRSSYIRPSTAPNPQLFTVVAAARRPLSRQPNR